MLEVDQKKWIFRTKEIWFCDDPRYDYTGNLKGYATVSFNACRRRVNLPHFKREEQFTMIIDLTKNLDSIWKNMSKSCRYAVSRAVRDGIDIKLTADYDEFFSMNRSFRQMKGLPAWSIEYLKPYGTLFISEFNGQMIGGIFYLEDESNIRWLVGASKRLEAARHLAGLIGKANRLLIWETIKYAKAKGLRRFDLGGYYLGEHGKDEELERVNFFKRGIGGEITPLYAYRRDYSRLYTWTKTCYDVKRAATQLIPAIGSRPIFR
jgi:lipid II:glycine glycyltransferase (peptidoglycan interpeptide bridge formation enzyme)